MLLLDSPAQERWQKGGKQEASAALRQEALQREITSNTVTVEDDAGRDTSNLLTQLGRPLASTEVQRRLHLCNHRLIFERAIRHPELTGIYIEKDERTAGGGWMKRKIHVCGMESGIMPEFSVKHQTTKRVPHPDIGISGKKFDRDLDWQKIPTFQAETRGWRTVLVRLLHLKLINREGVEKHFGWTPSYDSKRWFDETR